MTSSAGAAPEARVLAEGYGCFLIDLDGVLYRGDRPIPRAAEAIATLRERGKRLVFVTNNSSRTPEQVARKLADVGILADPAEVVTSALATADLLAAEKVRTAFVIGQEGILEALAAAGIAVRGDEPSEADVVVVGFDGRVDYDKLRTAALLIQRGARLVATNADASYPAPDGLWPGAGALLAAIITTVGRPADVVVGKPHPPLYRAALARAGGGRPLVVGDRLDTDIAGAARLGWDSLLVLTGVSTTSDLLDSPVLPTYLGPDLGALDRPGVRIRPAIQSDLPSIERLLEDVDLDAGDAAERLDETLVADEAGVVVGTVALELFDGAAEPGARPGPAGATPLAHLRSLAVAADRRSAGLGTRLVAGGVSLARERGARDVHAVTETAEAFFRRLGFERIGARDDLPGPIRQTPMVRHACDVSAAALRRSVAA